MYEIFKHKITKENYFSILIALFPLSFIAGNMIININIILLLLSSFLFFRGKVFRVNYFLLDKLIILFFLLVLLTGFINDYFVLNKLFWKGSFSTTLKSFLFLKYLLFYIVLRFLIENRIINLKIFFFTCALGSIFVCFDIFYQLAFGADIFGFEIIGSGRKLGGPFGDELIAGSYIQRFSIFSFFIIPIFLSNLSQRYLKYTIPILFLIFFVGILLSGNRMPLILFLLSICLIVLFQKQTRKYFISFIVFFSIIFLLIINFNKNIKVNFLSFYDQISKMYLVITSDNINVTTPVYFKQFATFYDTWLMNKYIGGGIKSFRYYCHTRPNIERNSDFVCNMHPHNYYLEVLTETGVMGFIIITSIFLIVIYNSFYKKYFSKNNFSNNHEIIPFIFLLLVEIFPIKSTGSFFTTGNTTYLFLIMGILVGLSKRENFIEKRN